MRIGLLKVWRDLWNNKGRTILVVVSIAVGVLAVGVTTSTLTQVTEQMKAAHLASHPAHGHLHLSGFVDDDTIESLANVSNVVETDGYAQVNIHWKASLEDTEWQEGRLILS